jgi:putative hemolysin
MNTPLISFLFLFGLILINGVFAMAEIAVISARKTRLRQSAEEGSRSAGLALELAESPGRFLSTIQVGITLIGILAGAFGEATFSRPLDALLGGVPWLAPYSRVLSVGVVVMGITYLSLVFGELTPKQIALNDPERIARRVAPVMSGLSRLATPLVLILSRSSALVLRLLNLRPSSEPLVTEEEIRVMLSQGTQSGVLEPIEEQIVEQVFRLGDQRVSQLATPRPEIQWLDPNDPVEETIEVIRNSGYSVYPVAEESLDNLLGVVEAADLLSRCMGGEAIDLRVLVKPALVVPETLRGYQLLALLKEHHAQYALTLDEYGGVQGLVTVFDLLESLVGELPEEHDLEDPDIVLREDGSYLLDGMLAVDRFKHLFRLERLPEEELVAYETVAGMVMSVLGRIPKAGDSFELPGLRLEVVDMDGNRIDKVLVTPKDAADL